MSGLLCTCCCRTKLKLTILAIAISGSLQRDYFDEDEEEEDEDYLPTLDEEVWKKVIFILFFLGLIYMSYLGSTCLMVVHHVIPALHYISMYY